MSDDTRLIGAALAERLGLTVKPGGLEGVVDGAPVQVRLSIVHHDPHHHGHVAVLDLQTGTLQGVGYLQLTVDVTLPFRPRLDAGLAIRPAGTLAALQVASRAGPDQRLTVTGREPERVYQLVPPAAREALDAAFVGDPGPSVDDGGIHWTWRGPQPWPTAEALAEAIARLPAAWTSIREAARTAPPPEPVRDAFAILAGLDLVPWVEPWGCPAGIVGEKDGIGVSVTVAPYHTGEWLVRAEVRLPRVIPGAPKVVREERFGWFDRLGARIGGKPEIEVGDAAFDRRFAVRSLRPDALLEVLDADVRNAMLALDALVPVQLGPTSIEAHGPVSRERDLVHVVKATLALGAFLSHAVTRV